MELTEAQRGAFEARLQSEGAQSLADAAAFGGFCCFVCALQLLDNVVLMQSAAVFNNVLYSFFAQVIVLIVGAFASSRVAVDPPRAVPVAAAFTAAASVAIQVMALGEVAGVLCAVLQGASVAVLSVCWIGFLSMRSSKGLCLRMVAGLFAGAAVAFVLFAADWLVLTEGILVVALALSGLPWVLGAGKVAHAGMQTRGEMADGRLAKRSAPARGAGPAVVRADGEAVGKRFGEQDVSARETGFERRWAHGEAHDERFAMRGVLVGAGLARNRWVHSVPVALLATLALCCLLSAFFAGVTTNPYGMQSKTIDAYMHLLMTLMFGLTALDCIVAKTLNLQVFVLGGLAMLLVGLLMLSTGMAGGIVVPVGLILAARGLSWGIGLIAIVALAQANRARRLTVASVGLLVANGVIGRGAGIMFDAGADIGFASLGVFGVACITFVAVAYALMTTTKIASICVPVGFRLRGFSAHADEASRTGDPATGGQAAAQAGESEPAGSSSPPGEVLDAGAVERAENADAGEAPRKESPLDGLDFTEKESNVADLLLAGMVYADIAARLGVSESTVKYHAKNIYTKAGVDTKREFIRKYTK